MRTGRNLVLVLASDLGLGAMGGGIDFMVRDDHGPPPRPKRRAVSPVQKPDHPAMPEGGWPESRQVRRARLRKETSDAD